MNMVYDRHLFDASQVKKYFLDAHGNYIINIMGVIWFTNIDHGRRHQPLQLMTMTENLKFNKKIKDTGYQKYDNYDAIEVPTYDAIPSDYDGIMGVPITFLDKYCPEQFEIVGCSYSYGVPDEWDKNTKMSGTINGVNVFKRILIRKKKGI